MRNSLSFLTLNLGLAHVPPLLRAPDAVARLARAPEALRAIGADVVALQEVFLPAHRRHIAGALRDDYPYVLAPRPVRSPLGSGLLILSRLLISHGGFVPLPGIRFTDRGVLWATLEAPWLGRLRLATVHLRAGPPARHDAELALLLRLADRETVLLGDFNCGPDVAQAAYRRIGDSGFIDAYAGTGHAEAPTWDAANPYNRAGRFRSDPSQRIDHVFVSRTGGWLPEAAEIVLSDPAAPLSDHYGLLVRLRKQQVDKLQTIANVKKDDFVAII